MIDADTHANSHTFNSAGALCEEDDNCGQYTETIYAKEVFDHPQYNQYNFFDGYDFTLVQLKNQSTIDPVPLDQGNVSTSYSAGQPLWVIGKLVHLLFLFGIFWNGTDFSYNIVL